MLSKLMFDDKFLLLFEKSIRLVYQVVGRLLRRMSPSIDNADEFLRVWNNNHMVLRKRFSRVRGFASIAIVIAGTPLVVFAQIVESIIDYIKNRHDAKSQKSERKSDYLSTLKAFRFILPPKHREEFSGDITEIYHALKEEGHSKVWTYFILFLNVANVLWVSFRFKWREYFEKERSSEKK